MQLPAQKRLAAANRVSAAINSRLALLAGRVVKGLTSAGELLGVVRVGVDAPIEKLPPDFASAKSVQFSRSLRDITLIRAAHFPLQQ